MGIADRSHNNRTALGLGEDLEIDDLVETFFGADTVYVDKQLVVARTYEPVGLRFSGEIDVTNRDAVAKCLGLLPAGEREVHLEVTELIFCDISGIRAFVDAAEAPRQGRLLLHGLPELLQTVMRVTGWADLPNLRICHCASRLT
jgi:anti-sigma B factor antagonist